MKRRALVAVPALLATLAGCPDKDPPIVPPPSNGVAAPSSATPPSGSSTWAEQAESVVKALDEVVAAAERGDKQAALKAHESSYFEHYECVARNLEVASQRFLPAEMLDGRERNVAIVREDLFAQIKSAVKIGAPAPKVRALVDELSRKIRDDAKKLDDQKVTPP